MLFVVFVGCHHRDDTGAKIIETDTYQIAHYESPTGYHFIATATLDVVGLPALLKTLYRDVWTACVVRNPLQDTGSEIKCLSFKAGVAKLLVGK